MSNERPIVIIGAGPAGLTAAWYLSLSDQRVVVLESDPHYLGGLARTVEDRGFLIDVGGHRSLHQGKILFLHPHL
jgi:protoporphyrinogen oxidase